MTIRELFVALGFDVDKKSEQNAEKSIKGISSKAKKLLGALGIAFSIKGLADLAQAAADVEALNSQFTQVFGDMEKTASDSLEKIADDVGSNVMRMKGSFTQIAAFSKTTGATEAESLELAERAMIAVADSAAFYDRSLEATTESLQSFLKGNFQQDAALGLSCTETTRNAKANELYGKSFKDLNEQQKQLTLLQMVEDANKLSGAVGQAARESDTWTNQLGNLKQSIQDLKATAGSTFLKPAIQALKICTALVQKATKAIDVYAGKNGFLSREVERLKNLFKFLQPTVERVTKAISNGMNKSRDLINKVVEKFGGLDNVLRIVTIALITLGALIIGPKLLGAIKTVGRVLKSVLNPAYLKMMAMIAVIVTIVLIIEDFINFVQGNDSVIGVLFEKAGIDADKARETIANVFNKIQEVVFKVMDAIGQFFSKHGDTILDVIGVIAKVVAVIIGAIAVVKIVIGIVKFVIGIVKIAITVFKVLSAVIAFLTSPIGLAIAAIAALIAIGVLLWKNWDKIKEFAINLCEKIKEVFSNIVTSVKEKVTNIKDSIVEGITNAINWIKELPAQAVQWGKDMIQGLIDGITGMVGKIGDAVKGIGEKIRSFLHFSVPDEGPLTDYESWMPDFMTGLADGIGANEGLVLNKVRNLASGIRTLMSAATAKAGTASASAISNRNSNVTQNVNIANSYTGGSMETQRNVSKAMKKSAVDSTTQMARALAYARG